MPDRDAVLTPAGKTQRAGTGFAALVQKLKSVFRLFADLLKNLTARSAGRV